MRTGRPPRPVADRFWEKVGPHDDPTKCWLWIAAVIKSGKLRYGVLRVDGKTVLAHRLSYEMHHHVTIPKGMTIDHVKARGCASTLCVNPHHLEVVTQKVNLLRGDTFQAGNAKKTHCPKGHPYNKENTHVRYDGRDCRVCDRAAHRERYHAKKAQKSI